MPDAPNKQLLENSIRQNFGNDITVSANLKQEIILTTADKAHLLAGEFMKAIEAKHAVDFPLGLFLAILTTFVTAEFHTALGFAKDTWSAFFLFVGAFCLVLVVQGLYRIYVTSEKRSIENFVANLKGPKGGEPMPWQASGDDAVKNFIVRKYAVRPRMMKHFKANPPSKDRSEDE